MPSEKTIKDPVKRSPRPRTELGSLAGKFIDDIFKSSYEKQTLPDWKKAFLSFAEQYKIEGDEWAGLIFFAEQIINQRQETVTLSMNNGFKIKCRCNEAAVNKLKKRLTLKDTATNTQKRSQKTCS